MWQLLSVPEDIHCAIDEVRSVPCSLDVSKLFERVDYGLLIDKLSVIGVKESEQLCMQAIMHHLPMY